MISTEGRDGPWGLYERRLYGRGFNERPLGSLDLFPRTRVMSGIYGQPPFQARLYGKVYPRDTGLHMAGDYGSTPSGGWKGKQDPANPDAEPQLDGWGWDDYWGCEEWMQWHKSLKSKYGAEVAKQKWESAWAGQGLGASALNCRSFNTTFRNFLDDEDLNAYYGLGKLAQPIGVGADVLDAATNLGRGAAKGASTVGDWLQYVVPVAAVAAAGIGLYVLYKYVSTPQKAVEKALG